MARLRLGYTKSRTGCLRCKQRRCDETRPSCRACVRHGLECSLAAQPNTQPASAPTPLPGPTSPPATAPHPAPAPPRRSRARPADSKPKKFEPHVPPPGPSTDAGGSETGPSPNASSATFAGSPSVAASPDPFPYLSKFVTGPSEGDAANWVMDLELMHHFTTCTFRTFQMDEREELCRLWQVEVPKQAFVHVFLLHQILAVSSYHLAHLHPHSRQAYSLRASQHQNAGIRAMRIALSDISPANCHALFASSTLLFIGSLAASSAAVGSDAPPPTVDDLVDVMILVKGIGSVLDSSQALLRSGPLSALFAQRGSLGQTNPALDRVVLAVGDFLVEVAEAEPDDRVRAVIHADAYRLVTVIRDALLKSPVAEYRVVAAWPIQMSDDLIPLLRQRNQAALALLSYYCVVFHAAQLQGYWFMQGWAPGVILDISRSMAGPWQRHSAWALGWITGHTSTG
ncbi:uncharacterized protein THITE_2144812 [Thermothielavioides terrestris NRRL 8126]|uniref:Zn(2)-C6 fungal-type domain-containing protein n=1 Tax=Thermothielavioides terrestris (strain ATCC 38088 / NRRL 8126) TaxID=578455 RepID=G2R5G4_THETT|nr:uncharacterized protein THITE_2144812 [Thermothielavioides terrestris NRRL 8126]AEO67455.1 hypothetical protein THITE_2144812 [Thermothielavioides terrestris NRRL 8126]